MKIPLPRQPSSDQALQHFDEKGDYIVKSGYQGALKLKFSDQASSSHKQQSPWKAIWSLELPEKVEIFMWRATRNLLPTAQNLYKKKILSSPQCQRCRRTKESIYHALVSCKMSKKVWRLTTFKDYLRLLEGGYTQFFARDGRKKESVRYRANSCYLLGYLACKESFIFENN